MNKILPITCLVFLPLMAGAISGLSMDFVNMSNQELFELRGAIQNAPEADRSAYMAEWEKE